MLESGRVRSLTQPGQTKRDRVWAWLTLGMAWSFTLVALCGWGRELSQPVRVALLDFACDDFAYRSWEQAKSFTALLQAGLPSIPRLEWVERDKLEHALSELEMGMAGITSADATARVGGWAGAQWALRGGFSTNDAGSRTLRLELVDLLHAEVFDSTNLIFAVKPGSRLEPRPELVAKTAALLGAWLPAVRARWEARQQQVCVAILPSQGNLQQRLQNLSKQLSANANVRLTVPAQARLAVEEADLGLLGLSDVSAGAWRQMADFFVWAGAPVTSTNQDHLGEPVLQAWDGRSAPIQLPDAGTASALLSFIKDRKSDVLAHRADAAAGDSWCRAISDSLAGRLENREEMDQHSERGVLSRAAWDSVVPVLETAAFLDPGNARIREAWTRIRWNSQLEESAVSHHRFRRLRSDAWARHLDRFGTNSFFKAAVEPVGYNAVTSALEASDSYTDRVRDGVPIDLPASVEVQWRRELMARLTDLVLRCWGEPTLRRLGTRILFTLAYDKPSDPSLRAKALDRLLTTLVQDPVSVNLSRWDPPASNGVARIFAAANREADGALWLRKVDEVLNRSRAAATTALQERATNLTAIKTALPRISALSSLDVQPAFDTGELDFPAPSVTSPLVRVRFRQQPVPERVCQLMPGHDAVWLIGEITVRESNPINTASEEVAQQGRADIERRLWRIDLKSASVRLWTNGIGEGEPWSVAESDNELWIGLDRGEIVTVDLARATTNLMRPPDLPMPGNWSRRELLREGEKYEEAASPVAAIAAGSGTAWASAMALSRFENSSTQWVEVLPRGPRREVLTANALVRWLAMSPPWMLARHAQLILANGTNGTARPFQPTWPGADRLLQPWDLKARPVGDGYGGFWTGLREELVWFDGTGSRVWRTAFEPPTIVKRDSFWMDQQKTFGMNLAEEFRPEELERMQQQWARRRKGAFLASRLPGEVTALAADGDWLWVATARGETWTAGGYRLSLLHMPSRRWAASLPLQDRVLSICATPESVWLGVEMIPNLADDSPVRRLAKAPWLAVPEQRWLPAEVSRDEVVAAEKRLTPRQRALRSLFRGEPGRFVSLYSGQDPALLDPETLFLLAKAHDEQGLHQPERRREFENVLIREYPESVFARWVRDERFRARLPGLISQRTPPDSSDIARRLDELFARYDEDQDGELSPREVDVLIEFEPDQFGFHLAHVKSRPTQGEFIVGTYRHHTGPGLNREELRETLRGVAKGPPPGGFIWRSTQDGHPTPPRP